MSGVAGWAIEALMASALLMTAVLLVRVPVRRAFGPSVAYALWALPSLRLLLPPLPAWGVAATPIARASETLTIFVVDPVVRAPYAGSALAGAGPGADAVWPIGMILVGIWLTGLIGLLGWQLIDHHLFCRYILAGATTVERRDGVTIVESPTAPGPLAFGVIDRYVAFPADIAERYSANERELALAHELGHHQRGDLIANWAALIVLALQWFNPLAWIAFHAFRADQELANDARVLAGRDPSERHAYACAILKAAHGGSVSAACHLHNIRDLKGRLTMLKTSRASRRRLVTGMASIALLTLAGLGLTASGTSAAIVVSNSIRTTTGVDLQLPAPPPPAPVATDVPAMPVPPKPSGKTVKRVVVVKDGKTTTYNGADAEAYIAAHPVPVPPTPPVPGKPSAAVFLRSLDGSLRPIGNGAVAHDASGKTVTTSSVTSITCSDSVVVRDASDGKQQTVICANLMAAIKDAQRVAANAPDIERRARGNARASLVAARTAIETERNLTDAQRQAALAGVAEAMVELDGVND